MPALQPESYSLKLGIGKNIMNETEILHLERLPHLLVAGQTGGGKSVCLTTIIASLLFQKTPKELKLLLIDPKRVEMSVFKNIPHLLAPVITNIELVPLALDKIIKEIEKRYVRMEQQGLNNIFRFNKKNSQQKMPFIVVIIDELADLILSYRKNVESKIVKICQIARAVGIYLIVATQRPSSDIITGLIKTNIPGRIAFNVTNYIDSRTILNTSGAEKLLGKGDLLFNKPGQDGLQRAQGAFLQESEIHTLTTF
ncbi:MAG: FtsK/SpoIIIE domain-containing protein [Mollicutes bacterium]|nr:MAG: FtsK/SpoIIIE domain-containing protein [Mollicutes bacterium]